MAGSQALGDWGEDVAASYLRRHGWAILARNFRLGRKEIDLVARRGGVVAFVEVKTRSSTRFGLPVEAIGPRKQREIAQVASDWIQRFDDLRTSYRFDAVSITLDGAGITRVQHLEDAWRP